MSSIIKVNTYQDANGNALFSSDGSGNVTLSSANMKMAPAFEAYLSADQSISDSVDTKGQFNTERFDTDGCYDNSTNYRFTPTTAGKYFVYANLQLQMNNYDIYVASISIYKNGSSYYTFNTASNTSTILAHPLTISASIDMNGSTDYVEIFGFIASHGGAGQRFESTNKNCYFGAYRLIGA